MKDRSPADGMNGSESERVEVLKRRGQVERNLGRLELASALYEEAVAICRKRGDARSLAHTVRHLGDIHLDAGRPFEAEPCYREALALYRGDSRTAPLDLANTVRPFAILKESRGEVAEAMTLWGEARDLYVQAKVEPGIDECSRRLALLKDK